MAQLRGRKRNDWPINRMNDEAEQDATTLVRARRIVVSDNLPEVPPEVRGRRLENSPDDISKDQREKGKKKKVAAIRRPYLVAALVIGVSALGVVAVLATKKFTARKIESPAVKESKPVAERPSVATGVNELQRTEELAKQVMHRISRDNRPYSFSESSLREIQTRTVELSRSSRLSDALRELQARRDSVGAKAAKEGLQPGLVMLLGLALSKGGESDDCVTAAVKALSTLATLNKTFGSTDGDSCLILIAAFQEGPGTRRSHPLLRRMSQVVTNPLTERNIWYLNEQRILSADAYALVIDTIAFGVITRNPREFGFDSETLNF